MKKIFWGTAFIIVFAVAGAMWMLFGDSTEASDKPLVFINESRSQEEQEQQQGGELTPLAQSSIPPTPAAPTIDTSQAQQSQNGSVIITLESQNNSNESGIATFSESEGKTTIVLTMVGAPININQPAHIHSGSCAALGGVAYPLSPVDDGKSMTVIDVTLASLKQSSPLAINVHKSASEIDAYVSCGDVKDAVLPESDGGTGTDSQ